MNEASQPATVTVRALLAHFHSVLDQAQRTGEPVIIAHRHRQPAGVLLGYEAWLALVAGQPPAQADLSTLRAALAAERERGAALAADLAAARRQVEEQSRDLTAARQRVAELEAQLASPQTASQGGEAWGVESLPEPAARLPETGASWSWGGSAPSEPPVKSGWSQS